MRFMFHLVGIRAFHSVDHFTLDFDDPENTQSKFVELYNQAVLYFTGQYFFNVTTDDYKSMLVGEFEAYRVSSRM